VNLRGRFRLRDAGPDGTRVTFRRIAARQVGRVLQHSLANVRAVVEP
jgi:hypothetical protein